MKTPRHVAIIMDGNGRWAKRQGEGRLHGHYHGVESVRSVLKAAMEKGIEFLTIYAFSTENWERPQQEVDGLMELLGKTILNETDRLRAEGVRMKFIGDTAGLPRDLQRAIHAAERAGGEEDERRGEEDERRGEEGEEGERRGEMTLIIALNYSSRWEITEAVRQIAGKVKQGILETSDITPSLIGRHLTTTGIPDPELLIRTSGEERLSNFLLWQLSYTELYFTAVLWPEFGREQFLEALEEYGRRERRFGKIDAMVDMENVDGCKSERQN